LVFQSFEFECTWWRLFQKRVVGTKFDIYVFIIIHNCHYLIPLLWCFFSNYLSYTNLLFIFLQYVLFLSLLQHRTYMCVRSIDFTCLYDFRTDPTVLYFWFSFSFILFICQDLPVGICMTIVMKRNIVKHFIDLFSQFL